MVSNHHIKWVLTLAATCLLCTACTAAPPDNADDCLLWKIQLPDGLNRQFVLAGNMAVVYNDNDGKLHAYSLADGKKTWESQTGHDRTEHPPPNTVAIGNILITHTYIGKPTDFKSQMVALASATGKVLWRGEIGTGKFFGDGENLFAIDKNRQVCRLSPKDGKVLWTLDAAKAIDAEPKVTSLWHIQIEKDLCLADVWHGPDTDSRRWRKLLIFEAASGKLLWELATPDPSVYYVAEDTVVGERLYVRLRKYSLAPDHTMEYLPLKVYELRSGKELELTEQRQKEWELATFRIKEPVWGCVVVIGNRRLFDTASMLIAHDTATGKRVWKHSMPKKKNEDDLRSDLPLKEAIENLKAAIEEAKESSDCYKPLALGIARESLCVRPVEHDGAVLLAVLDGLLALDLATGAPRWKYPLNHIITHGPFVRNDIAYFMTDDGTIPPGNIFRTPNRLLYALDLSKAKRLGPPEGEIVETGEE